MIRRGDHQGPSWLFRSCITRSKIINGHLSNGDVSHHLWMIIWAIICSNGHHHCSLFNHPQNISNAMNMHSMFSQSLVFLNQDLLAIFLWTLDAHFKMIQLRTRTKDHFVPRPHADFISYAIIINWFNIQFINIKSHLSEILTIKRMVTECLRLDGKTPSR